MILSSYQEKKQMKDNYFCDSNIFLYAFSKQDEDKQKLASNILLTECTISIQVINEVSSNMIKKLKFDNVVISKFVASCYDKYKIINFEKEIFQKACSIRDKYNISYYDSLILSSAISARCNILYSEDMQHNQKIEDLTIINPFI